MSDEEASAYQHQLQAVRREFGKQAPAWSTDQISPDLQAMVARLPLRPHCQVLDVAAGTGLLSRSMAPHVKSVAAVDLTPEMLARGRQAAAQAGIANVHFEQGAAEDLPYPAAAFDLIATRFSIHHFLSPAAALREMARVCRPGGQVAVIDLVAPEDPHLAAGYNDWERRRDASHARALPLGELCQLMEEIGLKITLRDTRDVEMNVDDWLNFAQTEPGRRAHIRQALRQELEGSTPTGLRPFRREGALLFLHRWGIVAGEKLQA